MKKHRFPWLAVVILALVVLGFFYLGSRAGIAGRNIIDIHTGGNIAGVFEEIRDQAAEKFSDLGDFLGMEDFTDKESGGDTDEFTGSTDGNDSEFQDSTDGGSGAGGDFSAEGGTGTWNAPEDDSSFLDNAMNFFRSEPRQVQDLRNKEFSRTDEGHQEYYFQLLSEDEQRGYREMQEGILNREESFYLTISGDNQVDRVFHALLKDHPELYWVHNRLQVYKTTYSQGNYCQFAPGYSYTQEEMAQIDQAIENAYQEVVASIPEGAGVYETIKAVYTYVIDHTEYQISEDDQSIAGTFWKKQAVCAGYAGAVQYLLERMGIPCIYVEGSAQGSDEGHAWNIVQIDGQYYYVDATNGDQPNFLEGDAVQLAEHKTTIYDYLCPFPQEYEVTYTPSPEFAVPACTSTAMNFYVLNNGCFDAYDPQALYEYCKMRLDNGAAVVRFKFSNQAAFDAAYQDWISGEEIQEVARYYMSLYGLNEIEYHYGIMDNLKTMYYMF